MTHLSIRRHARHAAIVALLVPPVLLTGCDDDNGTGPEGPDVNGTWAFVDDDITSYVRISDDQIEIFSSTGTCFIEYDFDIASHDGETFVVDTGGATVEWTIEEVGNNLVIEDDEGVSTTLTPTSANLSTLPMCQVVPETEFPHAACSSLTELELPGSVSGDLVAGDARWSDSTWYDVYRLQIAALTDVNLTMTADDQADLDAYLSLYGSTGAMWIDSDDDIADDDTDARIQTTLEPGCYIVVAGGWSGDDLGEAGGGYTVTASTELVSDFPHATCAALPALTIGGSVSGALEAGDPVWSDGTWYDLWSLEVDSEQSLAITMTETGSGIDTYMMLYNSLGTTMIDANDDIDYDGGNYNSEVVATLEPGCYIVIANSYEGDDEGEIGGSYDIAVTVQ